eukprot:jgi/Mesvir1/5582/Mv15601-RA.1
MARTKKAVDCDANGMPYHMPHPANGWDVQVLLSFWPVLQEVLKARNDSGLPIITKPIRQACEWCGGLFPLEFFPGEETGHYTFHCLSCTRKVLNGAPPINPKAPRVKCAKCGLKVDLASCPPDENWERTHCRKCVNYGFVMMACCPPPPPTGDDYKPLTKEEWAEGMSSDEEEEVEEEEEDVDAPAALLAHAEEPEPVTPKATAAPATPATPVAPNAPVKAPAPADEEEDDDLKAGSAEEFKAAAAKRRAVEDMPPPGAKKARMVKEEPKSQPQPQSQPKPQSQYVRGSNGNLAARGMATGLAGIKHSLYDLSARGINYLKSGATGPSGSARFQREDSTPAPKEDHAPINAYAVVGDMNAKDVKALVDLVARQESCQLERGGIAQAMGLGDVRVLPGGRVFQRATNDMVEMLKATGAKKKYHKCDICESYTKKYLFSGIARGCNTHPHGACYDCVKDLLSKKVDMKAPVMCPFCANEHPRGVFSNELVAPFFHFDAEKSILAAAHLEL